MKRIIVWLALLYDGVGPHEIIAQQSTHAEMSLDDLLNVEISTAARYKQTTREAPASVTVITSEDISRFGHRNLDIAIWISRF